LIGQVPFPGGSLMNKLQRHRFQEPAPVEQLRPEVPPAVAAVVRRLMAKRPDDRYQTPAELAAAPAAVPPPAPGPAGAPESTLAVPAGQTRDSGLRNLADDLTPPGQESPRARQQAAERRRLWRLNGAGAGVLVGLLALFGALLWWRA